MENFSLQYLGRVNHSLGVIVWTASIFCTPVSQAQQPPAANVEEPRGARQTLPAVHPQGRLKTNAIGPLILNIGASAFPYEDVIPETGGTKFLDADIDGRAFHNSPRGGKLFADKAFADPNTLLFIPGHFDPKQPAALILFLHGNLAMLARDVIRRQHVPEQLDASKFNAVLVAPQLAEDVLDSSAGNFWKVGFLDSYLQKAAEHLAAMSNRRFAAGQFEQLPVVIVAYSGGYLSTAFSLKYALSENQSRIVGVVLLDALFGEEPKFAEWIAATHTRTFFISAYSQSSAGLNARLTTDLESQHIPVQKSLPTTIVPGDIVFQAAPKAVHNDFVTQAYTANPLRDLLSRISLAGRHDQAMPRGDDSSGLNNAPRPIESDCPVDAPNCLASPDARTE